MAGILGIRYLPPMPPKRMMLIAAIFAAYGLWAAWETISFLLKNRIQTNLAFCLIPVAFGLVRGKASSRRWASIWCYLTYLNWIAIALLVPTERDFSITPWLGQTLTGTAALRFTWDICAFAILLTLVLHYLLFSSKSRDFFKRRQQARSEEPPLSPLQKIRHPFSFD